MSEPARVIIVDDHKIVRDGIRAMLLCNKSFKVIADVSSGMELFEVLKTTEPQIIVLDIGMPLMDGVEITEYLSKNYPQIKVLILSANTNEDCVISAIRAGASGFLPKESSREEFLKALDFVSRGDNYYGESISAIIYRSYVSILKKGDNPENGDPRLTEREMEVLKAFSEGLSFKEIAEKLSISARTVETHKLNILAKLGLKTTVDMVKYAIKNGIISL
jgi:DNA-binding NarL/FixJ family response regulator